MGERVVIEIRNGKARMIYSDAIKPVMAKMGIVSVARASHVEPANTIAADLPADRWIADMRPSKGPVLMGPDGRGWATRDEALAAEHEWLAREMGL